MTNTIKTSAVDETTTKSELYSFNLASSAGGTYKCQATWSDNYELASAEALLVPACTLDKYRVKPLALSCRNIMRV